MSYGRRKPRMDAEKLPQAERAVRAFNKLRPTLDGFARALAGRKDVSVRLGAATQTDGKNIYIMPPYELGNDSEHDRMLCDDRDDLQQLLCPACHIRERMLIMIYHEISHLAFGTFDEVNIERFARGVERSGMSEYARTRIADKARHERERVRNPSLDDVAVKINRHLPILMNAMEDARVDRRMMDARPGTEIMHISMRLDILSKGFKGVDGNVINWSTLSTNAQFMVAALSIASGTDPRGYLDERVMAAFEDPRLLTILAGAEMSPSVSETAVLATELLVRAQELGFFLMGNPEEDYVEPESEPEDEDEVEPEQADEESGELDGEGEDQDGTPEPGSEGAAGDGADDATDEDAAGSGSDPEESAGVGDGTGDSDRDDVDAPPAEDQPEGEGDAEPSAPEGESDGEGGSDAGPDDGEQGDADEDSEDADGGSSAAPISGATGERSDDASGDGASGAEAAPGDATEPGERPEGPADPAPRGADDGGEGDPDAGSEAEGDAEGDAPSLRDVILEAIEELGEGTRDEVIRALREVVGHDEDLHEVTDEPVESAAEAKAVEAAATYIEHFDAPSVELTKVNVVKDGHEFPGRRYRGEGVEKKIGESLLGPSLLHMRRAFTDNQRGGVQRNKRTGRVDARVLGRRAWSDDDRLFHKKTAPGKKDYAVLIGIDVSGSTSWSNAMEIEREAAYAQAELCHRLGIKFAVYAHTGIDDALVIYEVKRFDQPWNAQALDKLNKLGPVQMNLDGHTLEYYRKRLDEVNATHKVLMYYSDGAMPAENYAEELDLIQREIRTCRTKGYILMAVGAGSDDPKKYGMDTVRIDSSDDIKKVVVHLGKRITEL